MSKFKVGDRVRVLRNVTGLSTKDTYVGNVYEIANIQYDNGRWGTAYGIGEKFVIWDSEIEPATPNTKILITTDGTTTLARLYEGNKVVKSAEAKCAPSDKFDFTTGANLAYDRLMRSDGLVKTIPAEKPQDKPAVKLYCVKGYDPGNGLTKGKIYEIRSGEALVYDNGNQSGFDWRNGVPREWKNALFPLVKRPAKVGEWIYITKAIGACPRTKEGEVHQVDEILGFALYIKSQNGYNDTKGYRRANISGECEYLVLDGYKGENQ